MAGIETKSKRRLIEDFGILFEDSGLPRMSGRVFGWLHVSSPQQQTAGEIAAGVGASKGSMSTMLRMLVQFGMVDRVGVPGERSAYYRVKPAYWLGMMQGKMGFFRRFHDLAERALATVDGSDPERTRRLKETRDFYGGMERELTPMIERLSGVIGAGKPAGRRRKSAGRGRS